MESEDKKPIFESKSSMEILSELFGTFDAEPPIIVKKEKKSDQSSRKHKKSKKKHKHKDKKHKKKSKKRKRNISTSSSASEDSSGIDLTDILIKRESTTPDKSFLSETLSTIMKIGSLIKQEKTEVDLEKANLIEENTIEQNTIEANTKSKITIKNLKFSSIFDGSINELNNKKLDESGEITSSETEDIQKDKLKKHKRKHKHSKHVEKFIRRSKHRSTSRDKEIYNIKSKESEKTADKYKIDNRDRDNYKSKDKDIYKYRDLRDKMNDKHKEDHKYRNKEDKHRDDYKSREKDDYYRHKDDYKSRDYEDDKRYKHKDNPFYSKSRSEDRHNSKEDKWFLRDRYRGNFGRDRDKRFRDSDENHIDKKKLLEIARRNAIHMMKSGSLPGALTLGPQAQEKVIAAIRTGGKTVVELTDFCKTLSKKEVLGELSSVSEDNASESEGDQPFHHPFQIKDKPLTINIKNSVPLPIKSNQERASELRIQFPVSSGQQHRKTEGVWVPVSPKKIEIAPPKPVPIPIPLPVPPPTTTITTTFIPPLPIEAPPPLPTAKIVPPGPQVFPNATINDENVDIAAIVSQRLTAIRKLQENPHDVIAITQMYKAQKEMNCWAESKQQIGQFTGSTGAQILTQAELSSGYQAWARKDQLQTAAPVSGGMGMHLLQKMGWKPGEGLGKEKTGALEPLLLEVKLDKKGIVAKEEQKKKSMRVQKQSTKTLQGKHPVSLLGEFASKRKYGAPIYTVDFECGPDHKKNFLFKVTVNGIEYKPNIASGNKKEAKAMAAAMCLQQIGLLPP